MKPRPFTTPITALCLLTLLLARLQAQVTLPVPDKEVGQLVGVLEADGPLFEKAKACQQLAIVGNADAVPALAALLSDQRLATYARSALEAIPGAEADRALREAVAELEGDRLAGVLHSIGKRGDTQAIPALAKLLGAEDQAVRFAAARALGYLGTPQTADLLEEAFSQASGKSRRAVADACLICMQRLAAEGDTEQAVALGKLLSNAELPKHIQQMAIYNLILAQGKEGTAQLLRLLDSGDPEQFRIALQAAGRLGDDVNLSAELASRLDKQSAQRQALLLDALGDLGDGRVLPAVRKAARHDVSDVRVSAIGALAKLGDESCVPLLLEAATDADPTVAGAARAAIANLEGDRIDAAVVKLLDGRQPRAILAAMGIASQRNIASATPVLLRLARQDDAAIRQSAIQALGGTAALDHLPGLIGLTIQTLDSEDSAIVQKALQSACVRMPQEECAKAVVTAIPGAPPAARVVLLQQLAVVGGTTGLQAVVAAAQGDDDAMQDAATRLLGQWLSADAAPALLDLSKTLTHGKYRIRALRGYIRIARQLNMMAGERMEVCRNALAIADRNEEKKLVLDVLRRHPSPEGLPLAQSLLENKELQQAAQSTVAAITAAIGAPGPQGPVGAAGLDETGFVPLFDGKTLDGWKGDMKFWRAADGAIVGGSLTEMVKHNQFLRTKKEYDDFELRLEFQLLGKRTNAGVQIRTQEIPNHHEVSGYQADLGEGWWGCLYDESRRRKVLAGPEKDRRAEPVRVGDWNEYRIHCEGNRIQLWINGVQTVDYTESDPAIPQTGIIALQVHGKLTMEARYRNIRIKEL